MTLDWIWAVVGFLIMFGYLTTIGINKPRGMSVKTWCFGYLIVSVIFDILVIVALVHIPQIMELTNLILGLSAGAATGLAVHVAHHISEEGEHEDSNREGPEKEKPLFDF